MVGACRRNHVAEEECYETASRILRNVLKVNEETESFVKKLLSVEVDGGRVCFSIN